MAMAEATTKATTEPRGPFWAWLERLHREGRALPYAALALATLVLGAAYAGVFRGEPAGDDLTFHLAEIRRMADCLRAGDFDLWNDSANAGYASAYYYQAVPLVVPAALAALTGTQVLPWFQLCLFLPLVLVPLAGYRGLRLLWASRWAAALGGIAVAFTISSSKWGHGADGTFLVGLYTQTWAFAAFPLALGHTARWLTAGQNLGAAIAWGTFVGLCHPFAGIALGVAAGAGVASELGLALWRRVGAWRWPRVLTLEPRPHEELAPSAPPLWRALVRLAVLGAALLLASASAWLPVLIDYEGFGGFPHRVQGEDGPGLALLWRWLWRGGLLDSYRLMVLTVALPLVLLLARARYLRWLWSAAAAYAFLLSIGPHLVTQDDLLPAVRFLGSLQITLGLAIGAGLVAIAAWLEQRLARVLAPSVARAVVLALGAAYFATLMGWGAVVQAKRVYVAADSAKTHRAELMQVIEALAKEPPGRKQALRGATSHWWNLLPYVYAARPALLQMGGGGLQASPNYDFLWTDREPTRAAWLFDAPYVVFKLPAESSDPVGPTVFRTSRFEVRKLEAPGLASPVQVTGTLPPGRKPGHQAALAWLGSNGPRQNQHLAYHGHGGAGPAPQARVLEVTRQLSGGAAPDLIAKVEASAPSTIMFRESWHPRWTGLLDGAPVPVRRLTPSFAAIDVPAGRHVVALRFDRPWWALAVWALWPLLALAGALVSRRASPRALGAT